MMAIENDVEGIRHMLTHIVKEELPGAVAAYMANKEVGAKVSEEKVSAEKAPTPAKKSK